MRFPRLWRLAAACRLPIVSFILVGRLAPSLSAATVTGAVTDPDGRGVAGARVIVTTALGAVTDAITDDRGAYEIARLGPGDYALRVVVDGFQADPIDISVANADQRDVNVRLRVSAMAESIMVSAAEIDVPLSRAAANVTVISGTELQTRQIVTVADALRAVAGLSIVRSGGRGAITSLFPRGGGSNYTLVLVDGMRLNSFGGGYDFAHLSADDVERIEIVRGPQSAVFGSDAIGGVVQIVTRRGGRPRVEGLVEGGSQGTARTTAGASGSTGAWNWGGSVEHSQSDGFIGTTSTGVRVGNDDDQLTRGSATLGWLGSNGADVLISTNIGRDERGFPGPFGSDPIGAYSGVDLVSRGVNNLRQIGSRVLHPWSPRLRQRIEANFTDLTSDFSSQYGPSTSGSRRFDSRIQEDASFNAVFGASGGVEFIHERGSSSFVTGTAGGALPIERSVTGIYGELRVAQGERLFATLGIRLDHLTRDAVEADPFAFSPRPAFPSQTIESVNPRIAVGYLLTDPRSKAAATRIRANVGTGIRQPNVFEIAFTDNSNLQPERNRSVDAGIEQQLAGGAVDIMATAFFNRYDDLIVTVGRSLRDASRYRTDNISNGRARGFELSGDVRLRHGFSAHAAYTFLPTEILSADGLARVAPPPFVVGDALIRRPRHQGALTLAYSSPRVSAFAEFNERGEVLDLEPNFASSTFVAPGYGVLNAGATVRLGAHLQVLARGLNLADRSYEETLGYPALRRSFIVGVRVAASR